MAPRSRTRIGAPWITRSDCGNVMAGRQLLHAMLPGQSAAAGKRACADRDKRCMETDRLPIDVSGTLSPAECLRLLRHVAVENGQRAQLAATLIRVIGGE